MYYIYIIYIKIYIKIDLTNMRYKQFFFILGHLQFTNYNTINMNLITQKFLCYEMHRRKLIVKYPKTMKLSY